MLTDDKSDKKLLKVLRKQLEFYFSEGNLPHDKFMQSCISTSKHKSVLIQDLLKFNKLIELGATEEIILRAISKSDVIVVDEEGSGIKRKIELATLKPAESRTIYVCGLPGIDIIDDMDKHLRLLLSEYGSIVRIDVPKYPTSNIRKGFAFVEFLTRTSARSALAVHKPTDKDVRKAEAWKYFSYSNNQYNHALKQMEILGHPQKLFFEEFLGEQRKLKVHDKLVALAKKEWSQFRTQFYEAQRQHLEEMRALIVQYQSQQEAANTVSHKLHERLQAEEVPPPPALVPSCSKATIISDQIVSGSIVEFQCAEGNTKKTVKASLGQTQQEVAYIDFKDFNLTGFLRFKSTASATSFVTAASAFESVRLLSPQEEREYVDRMAADKETRKEAQKRKNQRKKFKVTVNDADIKKKKSE